MGRTIAAVIEPKAQNKRTYLEGQQFIITWAIGHLVSLAEPDQYDPKYKRWNEADLPIIPDHFKLWPNPRTKEQLKTIAELAKKCNKLVNACDAGREGQLIFHLIRQYLKLRQPVERLWISDLTPETIRRGFASLRSDAEYDNLTSAARARSEADWLVGMNASRAFTIRHRTLLSVGRVQTPVLALLYDRHKEITAFESETYYVVQGEFSQQAFRYKGVWQGDRLTAKDKAEAIAAKVRGKQGRIVSYKTNETKEYPFRLYDLTLLQREANGRFGYPAKKTLDLAQALYEKHKVITYPRTSSNYVTEENIPVMGKVLHMLKSTDYGALAAGADQGRVHKGNKAVCNPAKVEDHHAIIPTPKRPPSGLSKDELNIYDMIVRRFLSHYYPPAVYNNHEVITEVEQETFKTRAKEQLDPGWRVVLGDEGESSSSAGKAKSRRKKADDQAEDEDELLITDQPFSVDPSQAVMCEQASALEKMTKPPKPYTEGTLLKAMESAGKAIEDDELREAMKHTGLGTPATRAATIERLKQVGYISTAGKKLEMTAKGCAAIELIRSAGVDLLTSPEMTGRWEQRLHQISRGEASNEPFMAKVKQFAGMIVAKVKQQRPADASLFGEQAGREKRTAKGARRTSGSGKSSKSSTTKSAVSSSAAKKAAASATATTAVDAAWIADCPRPGCGGKLIEGKRGYGCLRFKEGCGFVIWKEQQGKKITAAMAKSLATSGKTRKITIKQADGTPLSGNWVLRDTAKGTIQFVNSDA